ncbi:hypothetical protein IST495A_06029 [Burkholderia multivorans]|nr:hypothetical protein IST495A_06029 [Burkholderia multivorans]
MTRLTDRHKTIPYFKRVLVSSDTWGRSNQFEPKQNIASPYKRDAACGPNAKQTASVQGVPCLVCGTVAPTMVADHKDALVVEYYRSGRNDVAAQSAVTAVQSHCPVCSRRQGGMASAFSKCMKDKLGL